MATNKKSVLLYCDLIHTVEKISDEDAGALFKHYLRYINDLNPTTDNVLVDVLFESIKQNLKRDLVKWEIRAERSRLNGHKGGRPKNPEEPSGLNGNLDKPRKPDTVKVTDTVTVIVNGILLEKETKGLFNEWLDFRKKMRKPIIVESTLISLAKKIKAEGYERSRDVIQHSMDNQYQGLFWKKQKEKDSTMELPTEYPKNSWE